VKGVRRVGIGVTLACAACFVVSACKSGGHGSTGGAGASGGAGSAGASGSSGGAGTTGTAGGAAGAGGSTGAAGSTGNAGATGAAGAGGTAGAAGRACGPPAKTYDFVREKLITMTSTQTSAGLYFGPGGAPLFIYVDLGLGRHDLRAMPRPEVNADGGVAVSVNVKLTLPGIVNGDPPLRVAKNGDLHGAYQNGRLHHFQWSGDMNQAPVDETIPADTTTFFLVDGLDLDDQGMPVVVYGTDKILLFARKSAGWQPETVGQYTLGQPGLLAFDATGVPVVTASYSTGIMGRTNFVQAVRGAGGWSAFTSVDPANPNGVEQRMYLDTTGQIQVFFTDNISLLRRRVVRRRDGTWDVAASLPDLGILDNDSSVTAVATGPGGSLHVVFEYAKIPAGMAPAGTPADAHGILYSYFDGCAWTSQLIDATPVSKFGDSMYPTIALDAAGDPHITIQIPTYDPVTSVVTSRDLYYLHPKP
jgi:hypothetical protein